MMEEQRGQEEGTEMGEGEEGELPENTGGVVEKPRFRCASSCEIHCGHCSWMTMMTRTRTTQTMTSASCLAVVPKVVEMHQCLAPLLFRAWPSSSA